ncbi:Endonuclease/exonuclease/phosphatase [Phaeosphaeria sp. MPI-PUGE-AT-0046c]|nr:Endonuclease/exonuclease/phosphatase [Phaeosphaeria sp. MPI-PUGE-AT-0046c]
MSWTVSSSITCLRVPIRPTFLITSTRSLYLPFRFHTINKLSAATQKSMSSSKSTPIMQALQAAMDSGPAQHHGDKYYAPKPQEWYYTTDDGSYISSSLTKKIPDPPTSQPINPKLIRLISWNIDVLVPHSESRMRAALQYLEQLTTSSPPEIATIIFLQEMSPSDMRQIRSSPWIASRFLLTDNDHRNWLSPLYGTTALIDRRLVIKTVFRVPWLSKFDRDGLFIDIALSNPKDTGNHDSNKVLRLCNTHLESLVADPPVRPTQIASAASYLHQPEVAAALLAGDLNAIQPFDRTLHSDNGLKDAYLKLGGQENSEESFTWGQQAPTWMREKFGCSRMDKILLRGEVEPRSFERIGMGVRVEEELRAEVERDIEGGWVTDHYGVMGDFELGKGWEVSVGGGSSQQLASL